MFQVHVGIIPTIDLLSRLQTVIDRDRPADLTDRIRGAMLPA